MDSIVAALQEIHKSQTSAAIERQEAMQVLKKIRVWVLNLSEGQPHEQALQLLLNAKGCATPKLLWGRLVADCASFAAARRSVNAAFLTDNYKRYFAPRTARDATAADTPQSELFQVVDVGRIPTGREVVAGTVSALQSTGKAIDLGLKGKDIAVFEFYRFDASCDERLTFNEGKCTLQNGLQIELICRAATFEGLTRLLERKLSRSSSKDEKSKIAIFESNLDVDEELKPCAVQRRTALVERVKAGISLRCVHCEKPISTNDADHIEYLDENGAPTLGLTHGSCTRADDRVVGSIRSEFFETYGFLRNFDAETWARMIGRGQEGYQALAATEGTERVLTWSGRSVRHSIGTHVVEFELDDGTSEFSYHRGQLERYSRLVATRFCDDMNDWIGRQRQQNDPLCLSDESLQFGAKSTILQSFGASEGLRAVVRAHIRPYRSSMAQRYNVRDNWFAPVAYIRALPSEVPLGFDPTVFLITEPLHLDRYFENWRTCGLDFDDYEVPILATDEEFDHFAREVFSGGREFLIDPLFAPGKRRKLLRGSLLIELEKVGTRLNGGRGPEGK